MTTTIVCTLVSRGSPSAPGGQGSEVLLFCPATGRTRGEVYQAHHPRLSFVLQTEVETKKGEKPSEGELRKAAEESVKETLLLDPVDLRFVRRSALISYAPSSYLVAFLFRTTPSYERGVDLCFAAERGAPLFEVEEGGEEEERRELDMAMYRVVEKRLGRGAHRWEEIGRVEKDVERMKPEHVSLAFSLVILPPVLDDALQLASSLPNLSSIDVAELALNTILQLVQARSGEGIFRRCWPPHIPATSWETKELPEGVVKYRLMLFWRDVVAHHFRLAEPRYEPVLSAVFLRVLLPLLPLSPDSTTSLSAFLDAILDAIASEVARTRFAAANVEKQAVAKLLERASREKRKVLHVITAAGGDPLVFGVLRELVHYVSTISAHPYASTNPHISALTHSLEVDWASRPNLLHLTIAESRPLCAGAVLASRLWDVSVASRARAEQLRQLATSYDNAYLHHPLSPGKTSRKLPSGLKNRVLAGRGLAWREDNLTRLQPGEEEVQALESYEALSRLVEKAEKGVHAFPPPQGLGGARVRVEVAPDNALASAMKASEGGAGDVIVLLGAEAVLPSRAGDVVATMGSWMLAEMAKRLKVKVFVVCTSDHILPSTASLSPSFASHDPAELYSGWLNTLASEIEDLDPFAVALGDKKQPDVRGWTQASEVVPGALIDGYITEKGVLSATGCFALSQERGVAETLLYSE